MQDIHHHDKYMEIQTADVPKKIRQQMVKERINEVEKQDGRHTVMTISLAEFEKMGKLNVRKFYTPPPLHCPPGRRT